MGRWRLLSGRRRFDSLQPIYFVQHSIGIKKNCNKKNLHAKCHLDTHISWDLQVACVRGTNLWKSKSMEEKCDCRRAQIPQKKLDA